MHSGACIETFTSEYSQWLPHCHSNLMTAMECTKFVFGRRFAPDPAGERTELLQVVQGTLHMTVGQGNGRKEVGGGDGKEKEEEGE